MRILSALSVVVLLTSSDVAATSFVMMSDEALFDQAAVVVDVSVLSRSPSPAPGAPSTDYLVLIERLLKGAPSGSSLVVRVAGGMGSDGLELVVGGAPSLREDQRVILFLMPRKDGTYGVLHLMLGVFHGVEDNGEMIAVRDFSEAEQLSVRGEPVPEFARNFGRFGDWLEDRSLGLRREADYFEVIEASDYYSDSQFVLKKPKQRFFEFDEGESVEWRINKKKQLPGTKHILKKSLNSWNQAETCTPIRLEFAGTTRKRDPGISDGVNSLIWEDPTNFSPGSFDCDRGGVIATLTWYLGNRRRFTVPTCTQSSGATQSLLLHKHKARVVTEADITTNDGAKCYLRKKPRRWWVFAHLLGHSLGLGHSCGDDDSGKCTPEKLDALMTTGYQQGRDGTLSEFDLQQIKKLY